MNKEKSCGLLAYKVEDSKILVFLVKPGGPFFKGKEYGIFSIPKGHQNQGETELECAKREFAEETGIKVSLRQYEELPEAMTSHKKIVKCFAFESPELFKWRTSNSCTMKYKGRDVTFKEIEFGNWFDLPTAMKIITNSQKIFVEKMAQKEAQLVQEQLKRKQREEAYQKETAIKLERRKKFMEGIGKTNSDVLL